MTQHWRRISRWFTTYRLVGRLARMDRRPTSSRTSLRSPNGCSNATWPAPRNGSPTSSSRGRVAATSRPASSGTSTRSTLDPAVRSSLFVNLLTEDNLPYYTNQISNGFGTDGAWGTWVRRWTAEEGRHSIVLRDYLTVTRTIDPIALERARMAQVECGQVPDPGTIEDSMVYVALQELATRIAHHNTGKVCNDPAGVRSDEADRERREPPLPLLPRPLHRRARTRSLGDGVRDGAAGPHLRDARHRDHRLRRTRACDRARRHLRLLGALRADPRAGRAAPLERPRRSKGSRPRPRWRATSSSPASSASAPRVVAWRTGAPRTTRSRSPRSASFRSVVVRRGARYALRRRLLWPPL